MQYTTFEEYEPINAIKIFTAKMRAKPMEHPVTPFPYLVFFVLIAPEVPKRVQTPGIRDS